MPPPSPARRGSQGAVRTAHAALELAREAWADAHEAVLAAAQRAADAAALRAGAPDLPLPDAVDAAAPGVRDAAARKLGRRAAAAADELRAALEDLGDVERTFAAAAAALRDAVTAWPLDTVPFGAVELRVYVDLLDEAAALFAAELSVKREVGPALARLVCAIDGKEPSRDALTAHLAALMFQPELREPRLAEIASIISEEMRSLISARASP